ncbi:hypothetical protein D4764_06G0006800 [Takifugu flavidus]|uniref:Uncharacterized protein n=1 Tax=Takifugu flavidus TaxID=433684 RepID=A0A5C6N0A6_9TELE|nr:hypothetical protein D4764_06G0006800 [Takifugu flavidus]
MLVPFAMSLRDIWKNYKVLIVMGSSLGLIHLGWYQLKANPLLHKTKEELVPEPGIITYISTSTAPPTAKSQ